MDPRCHEFINSSKGFHMGNHSLVTEISNRRTSHGSKFEFTSPVSEQRNHNFAVQEHNIGGSQLLPNQLFPNSDLYSLPLDVVDDDSDYSDAVLRYIDQMLMDENMEDKAHMLEESLDLQAKEMSFYQVLGKNYPPSQKPESSLVGQYCETPNDFPYINPAYSATSSSDCSGYLSDIIDPSWISSWVDFDTSLVSGPSTYLVPELYSSSSNNLSNVTDGLSPVSPLQMRDIYSESLLMWNFEKGVEEASKFLPSGNKLLVEVDNTGVFAQVPSRHSGKGPIKVEEKKREAERSPSESWVKRNHHTVERDFEEERSTKLPAIDMDSNVAMEEFDDVLLNFCKKFTAFRLDMQNAANKDAHQNGQMKASNGGKGRGKKQNRKKQVIDLQTLLITCAQAVAADDCRNANELLKQIRQHSSPFGDGNQRLAHYFADGLEARLSGTGSQIHKALVNKRTTAGDYLKAYYTYLASSPFRRIFKFASNKTILMKTQKEKKIHIVDFGILYGFQWPNFIRLISAREGGPPKLKITGIDFPQPGFRPAERIEETGRRLNHYAKTFKVPFEYNAVAQNWETIRLEDLKIDEDEFVVVNCINRTKNLFDETVGGRSSRTVVLNLIRRINPVIFIHGIVNGAYSAPFFVTRFKEVLFHFSALFDMLENNVPRDKPERQLIERDIFGREALNVIACEGRERVERPETYKQLQVRNLRAGFLQAPFDTEVISKSIHMVKSCYHKDFVIDEDSQWLLLGWKGRIVYAISCWKPV